MDPGKAEGTSPVDGGKPTLGCHFQILVLVSVFINH